jgi:hypothetical protein
MIQEPADFADDVAEGRALLDVNRHAFQDYLIDGRRIEESGGEQHGGDPLVPLTEFLDEVKAIHVVKVKVADDQIRRVFRRDTPGLRAGCRFKNVVTAGLNGELQERPDF